MIKKVYKWVNQNIFWIPGKKYYNTYNGTTSSFITDPTTFPTVTVSLFKPGCKKEYHSLLITLLKSHTNS